MKSDGLSPDVYSYAGCIDACAKAAQWKKACQILGQMREAGVEVGGGFGDLAPPTLHACIRTGLDTVAVCTRIIASGVVRILQASFSLHFAVFRPTALARVW